MNCFVTGASGFIGANLVHELVARGHRVKALLRAESDLRGLAGIEFTIFPFVRLGLGGEYAGSKDVAGSAGLRIQFR